ncbi:MAG: hypothetical protein QM831_07565 [Kofleriaceae bacterium]
MSAKKSKPQASTTSLDASALVSEDATFTAGVDAARTDMLATVAAIRTARVATLQRARAKTTGEAATALDARIAADTAVMKSAVSQSDAATKPDVTADSHETVVHGFVRDANGKGVAGVKLDLAQPKGDPLASVVSGKDGHFVLRATAATKAEIPDKVELRVHDKRHPTPVELERGTNGVTFTSVSLES